MESKGPVFNYRGLQNRRRIGQKVVPLQERGGGCRKISCHVEKGGLQNVLR